MKLSEAKKMRGLIEKAADNGLDDADALEGVALFPRWSQTAAYTVGQRVNYDGTLYRCLQAHTAQADWTPTAAPSLWAKVLIPDSNVIPDWEQPDSTNGYSKGDKVRHNGQVWVSILDIPNAWEPGVYGWEVVAE